jgi:hypothetical protein
MHQPPSTLFHSFEFELEDYSSLRLPSVFVTGVQSDSVSTFFHLSNVHAQQRYVPSINRYRNDRTVL